MKILMKVAFLIGLSTAMGSCRQSTVTVLEHQNAGDAASVNKDYAEAEKHYKAQLAEAEKDGMETPLVEIALGYLGTNYMAWGKYAEAEAAFKRRASIAAKIHGPESPEMLSPLCDITWLYLKQRRFDDAEAENRKALAIIARLPKGEHDEYRKVIALQSDSIKTSRSQRSN